MSILTSLLSLQILHVTSIVTRRKRKKEKKKKHPNHNKFGSIKSMVHWMKWSRIIILLNVHINKSVYQGRELMDFQLHALFSELPLLSVCFQHQQQQATLPTTTARSCQLQPMTTRLVPPSHRPSRCASSTRHILIMSVYTDMILPVEITTVTRVWVTSESVSL